MGGDLFPLPDEDEADLDQDSREILGELRRLCSEAEGQFLASAEERHLRLRLTRAVNDRLDLLVGDGYTEFTGSGETAYRGYLTPQETVARVRHWMLS